MASKYDKNHIGGKLGAGNCIFFNEALDDEDQMNGDDDDQSSDEEGEEREGEEDDEDEEEEEEGEYDPRVIAGIQLEEEDY